MGWETYLNAAHDVASLTDNLVDVLEQACSQAYQARPLRLSELCSFLQLHQAPTCFTMLHSTCSEPGIPAMPAVAVRLAQRHILASHLIIS